MSEHEYTVGETVFIVEFNGKPSHRTKVTEVRDLKRGPKVTCEDGSVWDVRVHRRWGSRSNSYYTGPQLVPHSDKVAAQYRALVSKSFVNWALHKFDELSAEQQESIRNVIIQIKREHKNKEQA
jgi:hypothetical protein